MISILKQRLHLYLCEYFPEKMIALQNDQELEHYLRQKLGSITPLLQELMVQEVPAYLIQEQCFQEMIADLGPSKFHLITQLLEEEFPGDYLYLKESGTLHFEVINMLAVCETEFKVYPYQKGESLPSRLRYALIGHIHQSLIPA